MTPRERTAAIGRARQAFEQLVADPTVGRRQLGHARDLLNRTHNHSDPNRVAAAIDGLEEMTRTMNATDTTNADNGAIL